METINITHTCILKVTKIKNKNVVEITPQHKFVKNMCFESRENSSFYSRNNSECEALLAEHVAKMAEKNGLTPEYVETVFPIILKILAPEHID